MPANARCLGTVLTPTRLGTVLTPTRLGTVLTATCLTTSLVASLAEEAQAAERRARLAVRVEVVERCDASRAGLTAVVDSACARIAAPQIVVQDRAGLPSAPAQGQAQVQAATEGEVRYVTLIY